MHLLVHLHLLLSSHTPYLSPESGRQFVVTVAGGARMTADRGDYVIAYALPKK